MKKNIFSISFFFLFLFASSAQERVPGYMGRKCSIVWSTFFSPAMSVPNSEATKMAPIQSLSINYVFNYRKEISLSIMYGKGRVSNGYFRSGPDPNYSYYSYYSNEPYYTFPEHNEYSAISSFGVSLGLKLFRRARFAPDGGYLKWEGIAYSNSVKINPYEYTYVNGSNNLVMHYGGTKKFAAFGGGFGFGRQRIFFDRMVVDMGIRAAIVLGFVYNAEQNSYEASIMQKATDQLSTQEILSVRLGIGFLAF